MKLRYELNAWAMVRPRIVHYLDGPDYEFGLALGGDGDDVALVTVQGELSDRHATVVWRVRDALCAAICRATKRHRWCRVADTERRGRRRVQCRRCLRVVTLPDGVDSAASKWDGAVMV